MAVRAYVPFRQIEGCVSPKNNPFPTVEITEKDKEKTYISAFKKPYNR